MKDFLGRLRMVMFQLKLGFREIYETLKFDRNTWLIQKSNYHEIKMSKKEPERTYFRYLRSIAPIQSPWGMLSVYEIYTEII